jgi:hypothetical protein
LQGFGLSTHKLYRFEQGTKGILGLFNESLMIFSSDPGWVVMTAAARLLDAFRQAGSKRLLS